MLRKIVLSVVVIGAALAVTGCGDDKKISTAPATNPVGNPGESPPGPPPIPPPPPPGK